MAVMVNGSPRVAPPVKEPGVRGLKILHITGWGRSGSTLLARLLNEVPGFFSAGELRVVWRAGYLQGLRCGCGRPIRECPIWSRAVQQAAKAAGPLDPTAIVELQKRWAPVRRTGALLRGARHEIGVASEQAKYVEELAGLYQALADQAAARVVVDSSKRPSDAALLTWMKDASPYSVQLVRDPRAVAYSWRRRKGGLARFGPVHSTWQWLHWNLQADRVRKRLGPSRTMLVRYEDFVSQPRATIEAIVRLLGEDRPPLPWREGEGISLNANHMIGGNPDRFSAGPIQIRSDEEWRDGQSRLDRAVATGLSLPLLHRYGYSWRARTRPTSHST